MIEEKDTVGDTAAGRDVEKNNLDGSDFASRAFSGDRPSTRLWSIAAPMPAVSSQAKSRPCSSLFLPIPLLAPLEEGSLKVEAPPTATSTIPEKKTGKKGKGKKSRPKSTRGSGWWRPTASFHSMNDSSVFGSACSSKAPLDCNASADYGVHKITRFNFERVSSGRILEAFYGEQCACKMEATSARCIRDNVTGHVQLVTEL